MVNSRDKILVAGFAQFPKGTPVYELQKVIGCILIIDKEKDMIIDATFTFLMDTTRDFLRSLVSGKCIREGIDDLIDEIEIRCNIPGQRALIQSVINAYERYCDIKESQA
ncbi:hypothetical protein J2S00_003874 [Caldalkalibacillus uzonensis]|uniref:DUF3870 domain-containing protein n=1 Tax=Caldalkalibacillus uzonensis TaxID=353224 RepID=A0ABU0CY04_9BACI|nr:DUF3870 domain-containing protein [Caldalkalibacillus uzonensis]MDQ0341030.1 hypothetical protein [Caldalkalibacillus uzonensis]